ncbi:MAG: hypothetical protein ACRD07_17125 [Acidimicrobiales bacterium]
MTNTTTTTDVAVVDPEFSDAERYALAAFLAGYRADPRGALREPGTSDAEQPRRTST